MSGDYHIAATYCEPDSGPSSALQILTHGLGADRTYWNLAYNNYNYSYVNQAVDKYGYSTFAWDRLGIAGSSHGNAVDEIQAALELDALKVLTMMLKTGGIKGLPKSFDTTVHVGHSYGSQETYALTAMYPGISDCIALTGFSQNGSFALRFDYGGDYILANTVPAMSDYPDGYMVNGDQRGIQADFLAPNEFDPGMLAFLAKNPQPITVGERLSGSYLEAAAINKFAGPVHIVTGERDLPFCGGNCSAAPTGYTSIPATSIKSFPDAKKFEVTIGKSLQCGKRLLWLTANVVPKTGHGLNFQYTWPTSYGSVLEFLVQNGCEPKNRYHHWRHGPHRGPA